MELRILQVISTAGSIRLYNGTTTTASVTLGNQNKGIIYSGGGIPFVSSQTHIPQQIHQAMEQYCLVGMM